MRTAARFEFRRRSHLQTLVWYEWNGFYHCACFFFSIFYIDRVYCARLNRFYITCQNSTKFSNLVKLDKLNNICLVFVYYILCKPKQLWLPFEQWEENAIYTSILMQRCSFDATKGYISFSYSALSKRTNASALQILSGYFKRWIIIKLGKMATAFRIHEDIDNALDLNKENAVISAKTNGIDKGKRPKFAVLNNITYDGRTQSQKMVKTIYYLLTIEYKNWRNIFLAGMYLQCDVNMHFSPHCSGIQCFGW